MPIYMDVHIIPGVSARNVAEAHQKDLMHQEVYGCKCMTYWIDESRETVFCLIEAPDKNAVEEMHEKAHGLTPNKIIEVNAAVVESFLGRIYDPEEATITDDGLKVFQDASFRILAMVKTTDPVLLRHQLGLEKADALLHGFKKLLSKNLVLFGGREVEAEGSERLFSFRRAGRSISFAVELLQELPKADATALGFRMGISAGEPVANSQKMFGDAIKQGRQMCAIAKYFQVAVASTVKNLLAKEPFELHVKHLLTLSPSEELLLASLFDKLEEKWHEPEFNIEDYCHEMAMSQSQLYRKTIALTGMSPNALLKEFRLEKAKEMMKMQYYNIAQITFDSGFTSPSYFTKCFKSKFGLLPIHYMKLLAEA